MNVDYTALRRSLELMEYQSLMSPVMRRMMPHHIDAVMATVEKELNRQQEQQK